VSFSPSVHPIALKEYLGAKLRWRLFRGDADQTEVLNRMSASDEDEAAETETENEPAISGSTINDDEVPQISAIKEFTKCRYGYNLRSAGTIQHDVFQWVHHKESYSNNDYILAVTAQKRWSSVAVPFAVVVRLEETSRSHPIYTEVADALITIEQEIELQAKSEISATV
jgi:hypothetical protein